MLAASACNPSGSIAEDSTASTTGASSSGETTAGDASADTTAGEPQAPAVGVHESGTRLRARILDAGDGATLFQAWWDTELELECQIAIAPDGIARCLPTPRSVAFLDSLCTEPAIGSGDLDALAEPFTAAIVTTCDGPAQLGVFTLGATVSVDTSFNRFLGACEVASDGAPVELFTLEPSDPSVFAGGELFLESHGGVEVEVFVGDDGARLVTSVRDPTTTRSCTMSPVADGDREATGVCLPTAAAGLSYAIDRSCHGEVALTCKPIDCPDPTVVFVRPEPCSPSFELFAVGDGPGTELCPLPNDFPVCPYFEVGDAIDPSSFPSLTLAPRGTGRLRAHDVIADDGQAVAAHASPFWDEELGLHCGTVRFDWMEDDAQVCLVDVASDWIGFADPECTRPVVGFGTCHDRPPSYAASDFDPWDQGYSSATAHLYAIEGPLDGDTVYTPECVATSFTGELWIVGDEISTADGLPMLVMRTE